MNNFACALCSHQLQSARRRRCSMYSTSLVPLTESLVHDVYSRMFVWQCKYVRECHRAVYLLIVQWLTKAWAMRWTAEHLFTTIYSVWVVVGYFRFVFNWNPVVFWTFFRTNTWATNAAMVMGKCIHVQTKHTDIVVEIDIDLFLESMWYLQTKMCISVTHGSLASTSQLVSLLFYAFLCRNLIQYCMHFL